jgi:hypothetical protein
VYFFPHVLQDLPLPGYHHLSDGSVGLTGVLFRAKEESGKHAELVMVLGKAAFRAGLARGRRLGTGRPTLSASSEATQHQRLSTHQIVRITTFLLFILS